MLGADGGVRAAGGWGILIDSPFLGCVGHSPLFPACSYTHLTTRRPNTSFSHHTLSFYSELKGMMNESNRMAPSTRRRGVRRISGEGPVSAADERVDSSGSSIGSTLDHSPCDRPASFSIHFTNIRGLNSNLPSVEHHLATFLPNILLLSETQLSSDASSTPFQISHYNLYSKFRLKGGVCAFRNINTPIARFTKLDNPLYDVIWLRISLRTTTICLLKPRLLGPAPHRTFFLTKWTPPRGVLYCQLNKVFRLNILK